MLMNIKTIPENWRDSVSNIIAAGRTIAEQRRTLPATEYRKWLVMQPVGDNSTAQRLAAISLHPVISDPKYANKLPPQWGKLYELCFLPLETLAQKIANGGVINMTKYEIWRLRGLDERSAPTKGRAPVVPRLKDSIRNAGGRFIPPNGESISDFGLKGLDLEKTGMPLIQVAETLGMYHGTWGKLRLVLMLAARTDWNAADRKVIDTAIAEMNRIQRITPIFDQLRPFISRVWGKTTKRGRPTVTARPTKISEERRKEGFMRAITVIDDTCQSAVDIEIPHMSIEEIASAVDRMLKARASIGQLVKNLRRSGYE